MRQLAEYGEAARQRQSGKGDAVGTFVVLVPQSPKYRVVALRLPSRPIPTQQPVWRLPVGRAVAKSTRRRTHLPTGVTGPCSSAHQVQSFLRIPSPTNILLLAESLFASDYLSIGMACANSRYRQKAFASCICRGVRHSASKRAGDPTTMQMHFAREVATFSRFEL
jgi:hypothetical protein